MEETTLNMENMPETLTFDSEIKIPDLEVEKSQNGGDEHDRSLAMEVGHSIRDIHSNWRGRDFGNEPSCRQNEEKQIWEKHCQEGTFRLHRLYSAVIITTRVSIQCFLSFWIYGTLDP